MYCQQNYNQVCSLQNDFRLLWEQHIVWTRAFIVSTVDQLADQEEVTNRLLQNPTDMANTLSTFYGINIAKQFEELFREHLLIAAKLVNAAIEGDSDTVEKTREDWYENAHEISVFLASINPHWNQCIWQKMLFEHLDMTENLAVARLKGRYQDFITLSDAIEHQALMMADYMSESIIRQFGNRVY